MPAARTLLLLLISAPFLNAAEPTRDAGLSVHILPDRVAKISGERGGFAVADPTSKAVSKTYGEARELLAYVGGLSATVQRNGIWVVTTHPTAYSEPEQAKLKELITLSADKNIPVFTCRGSELPNGWKRAK